MSDTTNEAPRNDAGQFASNEPAYGREGLERAAGYKPLPDESKEDAPPELTEDEAAQRLSELSGPQSAIVTHSPIPGSDFQTDGKTLELDQAATMLAEARDADKAQAEIDGKKAAQKEVDKLRGEKPAAPQIETEIDVDRALANPRIRDAIAQRVSAADTQREAYATRVVETGTIALAALGSDFPELHRPLDQWEPVLRQMHAREPARFQQAMGRIQSIAQIQQAHDQITAEKTGREQAEFRDYSAKEDARFAAMVKGERNMPAIEAEIVAMVKDHGVEPREFFKLGTESKFLRSAAAQKILVDAAKYRMMQKAAKAAPTRDVPTVQKPGSVGPRVNRSDVNLATLSAKLSNSGNLKDAQALLAARRSKGR
jgi:hypothetical protein